MKANKLLEWVNTKGQHLCLLWVVNDELDPKDTDYEWLEVAAVDEEGRWQTKERVSFVDKFEDYGIPEDIV